MAQGMSARSKKDFMGMLESTLGGGGLGATAARPSPKPRVTPRGALKDTKESKEEDAKGGVPPMTPRTAAKVCEGLSFGSHSHFIPALFPALFLALCRALFRTILIYLYLFLSLPLLRSSPLAIMRPLSLSIGTRAVPMLFPNPNP